MDDFGWDANYIDKAEPKTVIFSNKYVLKIIMVNIRFK